MRLRVSLRTPFMACALFAVSTPALFAKTYYVSPKGQDGSPGTEARPWRTLQKASRKLKPGDTVLIANGTYPGGVRQSRNGRPGEPITYQAINPGKVILEGDETLARDVFTVMESHDIVIDGLTAIRGRRAGFWVASSDRVTIRNCRALNNRTWGIFTSFSNDLLIEYNECAGSRLQHGIYVSNSGDRVTVRYNIARNNANCGIQFNGDAKQRQEWLGAGGDGIIENAVVEGNVIFENGRGNAGAALNLLCVHNALVSNNLLYNNEAGGIALYNDHRPEMTQFGSKNIHIVNNTVYFKPDEGRWCISFRHGSTDNVVANNILHGGARGAYQCDDSSSFTADNNVLRGGEGVWVATNDDKKEYYTFEHWQALSGNDLHSTTAAPRFVSPTAGPLNFRLAAGSPAIGSGVDYADVLVDIDGRERPAGGRNLGCFEGGEAPAAPIALEADVASNRKFAHLRWESPTEDCEFTIRRSEGDKASFETVASGVRKNNWTDKDLQRGRTYWYVVTAVSGGVESRESRRVRVDTP